MYIKRIEIGQFGNLKNYAVDFSLGANLLLAPNEWGKSTLIDFIFAALYGMDHNNADLKKSSRSRNMPWGENSMSGAIFFEADAVDYRVSCEFGSQQRLDKIFLTDENLGTTRELDRNQFLGKELFGLGRQAFMQSVYVQQMSLALDMKEDREGELLHQLASLGTAGTTESSHATVSKILNETLLNLNSPRRKNAIIPNLEAERQQQQERLREAREREQAEANDLLSLAKMAEEVDQLQEHVIESERKLEKTEYLISLDRLQERINKEKEIREREQEINMQLKELDHLKPAPKDDDFLSLAQSIRHLQLENSVIENSYKDLEIERGAMQHQLNQAYQTETADSDAEKNLTITERRRELRSQEQLADRELRNAYSRQEQAVVSCTDLREQVDKNQPEDTGGSEKKSRILGLGLIALSALALLLGFFFRPAFFFTALVLPGIFFIYRSRKMTEQRLAEEKEFKDLQEKLAASEAGLSEIKGELEDLEQALAKIDEAQNMLEDEEAQIIRIQQEARLREENYKKGEARFEERRTKLCEDIDKLLLMFPYLNTDEIVTRIQKGEVLPTAKEVVTSIASPTPSYSAKLFREDSDSDRKRHRDAVDLFRQFSESYNDLSNYLIALGQERHNLKEQLRVISSGKPDEKLLPSEEWCQLLEKAAEKALPSDEESIAEAIAGEYYPDNLEHSASRRRQDLQFARSNYNQLLSDYSRQQAHMALVYRYTERSESIEKQIKELETEIDLAERRERQIRLALGYLDEADEEMRRNFSPELRVLTAKYLKRLTLGRYDDVLVDTDMNLQLHQAGETQFRRAEFVSGGCYDQVYLALRLALSELISGDETPPLVLDDVLVQFDDERMRAALSLLAELSREKSEDNLLGEGRQLLLFSCQDRIATVAESLGYFNIQRMERI